MCIQILLQYKSLEAQRSHHSPSRESTNKDNMELYSTPDRSEINLLKNFGKSTLKGCLYANYPLLIYLISILHIHSGLVNETANKMPRNSEINLEDKLVNRLTDVI